MEKKINPALIGEIVQAIGPVIDVRFEEKHLPEILTALHIPLEGDHVLVVEVMQHIGDDVVRCVAMGPTDGIVRGMQAINTESPITVPVGKATLGRMFNVLGNPIDGKDNAEIEASPRKPIHRPAPTFSDQPSYDHIGPHGHPGEKPDDQNDHRSIRPHSGHGVAGREPPDDRRIRRVEHLLQDAAGQERQREKNDPVPERA